MFTHPLDDGRHPYTLAKKLHTYHLQDIRHAVRPCDTRLLSVVSRRRRRGSLRTSVTCPPGLSAPFSLHGPLSHVLGSTPCERDRLGRSWDSVRSVCRKWGIIATSNASTRKSSNLGYRASECISNRARSASDMFDSWSRAFRDTKRFLQCSR